MKVETTLKTRIHALDLLRGFALLGILIMNIISFSHIGEGYINPTIGAGLEGHNKWVHAFNKKSTFKIESAQKIF